MRVLSIVIASLVAAACAPQRGDSIAANATGTAPHAPPSAKAPAVSNKAWSFGSLWGFADHPRRSQLVEALTEESPEKQAARLEKLRDQVASSSLQRAVLDRKLVLAYARLQRFDDLEAILRSVPAPDGAAGFEVRLRLAEAYAEAASDLDAAREHAERARTILDSLQQSTPGRDATRRGGGERRKRLKEIVALIELRSGNIDKAIEILEALVQAAPVAAWRSTISLRMRLGRAHEQAQQWTRAAKHYAAVASMELSRTTGAEAALEALRDRVEVDAIVQRAQRAHHAALKQNALSRVVAEPLPAVEFATEDGPRAAPELLSPDRITVLTFWTEWCQFCKRQLPQLADLEQADRSRSNARFVAVSMDENLAFLRRALEREGMRAHLAHDPGREAFEALGGTGTPLLVVVGPEGRIRFRNTGHHPGLDVQLRVLLEALEPPS